MPWYDPGRFAFPIKDYRWGCANFLNAWLGFHDMSAGKLYYHYGVDLGGMYPKHHRLVSMIPNAEVLSYGAGVSIRNSEFEILYYHMVDRCLREDLGVVGSVLDRGEMFGYLGNSGCGNDAHVHIDMRYVSDPKRNINCFPILVQAYLEKYDEPLSFPGHKRHCYVADTIELEGSLSVAPRGRSITSYEWTFTDGTTATAANVRRTYGAPGAYAEELTVTDSAGKRSSNYVMAFVYDRQNPTDAPYADSLSHFPARGIVPGTPLLPRQEYDFRTSPSIMATAWSKPPRTTAPKCIRTCVRAITRSPTRGMAPAARESSEGRSSCAANRALEGSATGRVGNRPFRLRSGRGLTSRPRA